MDNRFCIARETYEEYLLKVEEEKDIILPPLTNTLYFLPLAFDLKGL
jgi:hypothetical protein